MTACVCVRAYLRNRASKFHRRKTWRTLPVDVVRSSSGGVLIRYVIPVLWTTSCFLIGLHDGPYMAA